jgi:uncharacterized protein YndB with AHSA1/START domain
MPKAYASTVLNAPAAEVWALLRDFNGMPGWHPAVADSAMEDGRAGDQTGGVRSFHLQDGAHLRERLLSFSDVERSFSYNFEKTPFSVANYHATLRVTPVTDGDRAFVEWWTTFDCEPEKIDDWVHTFAGVVFKSGLDALKERFGG